jgi:hypothetical protein
MRSRSKLPLVTALLFLDTWCVNQGRVLKAITFASTTEPYRFREVPLACIRQSHQ